MNTNKIINVILAVAAILSLMICLLIYFSDGTIEIKGITVAIACIIAIKQPGKRMPSYQFYKQSYDFLQENNFQGLKEQKMIRKALFYFNMQKYEKSAKTFEKLLDFGNLHSNEISIIQALKENVESYYKNT